LLFGNLSLLMLWSGSGRSRKRQSKWGAIAILNARRSGRDAHPDLV
jgi:hypothetical protein